MSTHLTKITALFCFSFIGIQAQIAPQFADTSTHITLGANAEFNSNAVTHELFDKFVQGGYIDEAIKDNAALKLKSKNNIGVEIGTGLSYQSPLKKSLIGISNAYWGINVGTQYLSFNQYTADFYNLVFYGNNPYAGKTLNMDGTAFSSSWYHQIGLTLGIQRSDLGAFDRFELNINPSFLMGVNYTTAEFSKAKLFTEENGEYIDLVFSGKYSTSDTIPEAAGINGYGAVLNLQLQAQKGKNHFAFSVTDLGFISFQNKFNYELDSSFSFGGLEIEDIFNIQDTLIDVAAVQDSLLSAKKQSITQFLPFSVSLFYQRDLHVNLRWSTWVKYRYAQNYIPFISTRLNYVNTNQVFHGGVSFAYGGYGGFQPGVNVGLTVKGINLEIGTSNFLTLITPSKQTTGGVFVQLEFEF